MINKSVPKKSFYKRRKYGNTPTVLDGIRFASKSEALRYADLKLLQRAGAISDLVCQPKFPLIVNGQKIADYFADFSYKNDNGQTVVEDVKSEATLTPVSKLKIKLMFALHGIEVAIVSRR